MGEIGDRYEQHADAVADAVVRGEPAAPLLDAVAPASAPAASGSPAVQRKITLAAERRDLSWREVANQLILTLIDGAIFLVNHRLTDELARQLDAQNQQFRDAAALTEFARRSLRLALDEITWISLLLPDTHAEQNLAEDDLENFMTEEAPVDAALDRLQALAPEMRRLVAIGLAPHTAQTLFYSVSLASMRNRKALLDEVAAYRAVDAASQLEGKLEWSGPSSLHTPVAKSLRNRKFNAEAPDAGLMESNDRLRLGPHGSVHETIDNDYARWVNDSTGEVPAPTSTSTMNCWQAVLYTCHVAGLLPKKVLRDTHTRAMRKAHDKDVARASTAYNRAVEDYLLSGGARRWDGHSPIPAGHVILFNHLYHVALSLGSTRTIQFEGSSPGPLVLHDAMSLWRVDQGGESHFDNRRISVEELAAQSTNQHNRLIDALDGAPAWDHWHGSVGQCDVVYAPPRWGG